MSWIAPTLWHLMGLVKKEPPQRKPARGGAMQARYDALVDEMKRTHGVRVRKWRTSTSGCAWMVRYHDGNVSRLIEAPYPRGPVSCAVFLHEIGHHAIGWDTRRLRCVEEHDAWQWALAAMRARKLNVTAAVERRVAESLRYAVQKALRRGLKRIPPELLQYA
ncbi:MAG: hypothetical protein ACYSU7_11735 [Planctomycetota bacterium]